MGEGAPTVLDVRENLNGTGYKEIAVLKACSWDRCPLPSLKLLGSPGILLCFQWGICPAWSDPRLPLLVKVRFLLRPEIPLRLSQAFLSGLDFLCFALLNRPSSQEVSGLLQLRCPPASLLDILLALSFPDPLPPPLPYTQTLLSARHRVFCAAFLWLFAFLI